MKTSEVTAKIRQHGYTGFDGRWYSTCSVADLITCITGRYVLYKLPLLERIQEEGAIPEKAMHYQAVLSGKQIEVLAYILSEA
jgi:hypothetical protein